VTVTLPPPSAVGSGATYYIKAFDGVTGTLLHPNGTETIDQYGSYPVFTGGVVQVVTDGTNWFLVGVTLPVAVAHRFPYRVPTTSPTNVIAYSVPVAGMYRVSGFLLVNTATLCEILTEGGDGSGPYYWWQVWESSAGTPTVLNSASLAVSSYAMTPHTIHAAAGSAIYVSVTLSVASSLTISAALELVAID
jgi:hypothetical protein